MPRRTKRIGRSPVGSVKSQDLTYSVGLKILDLTPGSPLAPEKGWHFLKLKWRRVGGFSSVKSQDVTSSDRSGLGQEICRLDGRPHMDSILSI